MLEATLPPYLACGYLKELIVVDDGSTDGTERFLRDLANHDPRVLYTRLEQNQGRIIARNTALARASGDLVLVTDDDFLVDDNYLETLIEHMLATGADMIAGRTIWMRIGETTVQALTRANDNHKPLVNERFLEHNSHACPAEDVESPLLTAPLLLKRTMLDRVTFYDGFGGNAWREETDFEFSALECGYKLVFCPHAVAYSLPRANPGLGVGLLKRDLGFLYWIFRNNVTFLERHYHYVRNHYPKALVLNSPWLSSLFYTLFRSVWLLRTEAIRWYLSRKHEAFVWKD
jgi:glycosyltransferase involved in cell wall biosynthesis